MQKFVPQSRVRIFCNERTRSTPLDPKMMFWFISYYLGAVGTVWLPYETRCTRGRSSAKVRNERTQSTPLDPKLTFWCVRNYLGAFETVWLSCKTRCKTDRTSAKVCATKSHSSFPQERTRATPLYPKLIFWPVLYYLGAFGIVWLAYETRCKTG